MFTLFGVTLFQPAFVITGCEEHGTKGVPYMTRYRLVECKAWALYLHIFHRSDADSGDKFGNYHDHPWPFTTWILWNGYVEEVPTVHPLWDTDPEARAGYDKVVKKALQYIDPAILRKRFASQYLTRETRNVLIPAWLEP